MNFKKIFEKRESLRAQLAEMLKKADDEERAFNDEERATFEKIEQEINDLTATLECEKRSRDIPDFSASEEEQRADKRGEEVEERAFAAYILGKSEELRAGEQNLDVGNNGAIIPESITNRIIKAVKDKCPIFERCEMYSVKGNLKIPKWGNSTGGHNIAFVPAEDFVEVTPDSGAFTSVSLGGYLYNATVLISRTLENNAVFDVTSFIVNQIAEVISIGMEGILLTSDGDGKPQGAINTTNGVTAAATTAITGDELIELQARVKQAYQANACWTMHPTTFTALKKLKDGTGRYMLGESLGGATPFTLLGKPVYISDNMPTVAAGAKAILYGDYSGLAVNVREGMEIMVLREKYATQHAIGVTAYVDFDAKVANEQKLAVLTMAAS